ncbi:hypothetical protein [Muricoccus radiodurans]|uniref:hypothetical protein n=1 Tax=Muricoccus radiodurans TaxID=2231721 RepID=UPI003CEFB4AC
MSDENYDDGLVHSHGWATDKAGPVIAAKAPTTIPEAGYDDGLVHSHDWARGDSRTV